MVLENIKNMCVIVLYGNVNAYSSATASGVYADVSTAFGVYVKGLVYIVGFKDLL